MQEASEEVGSGMLTMTISHQSKLGLAKEAAMKFCKSECGILNPVVQTASYLTPYHKVVAGHNEVCASSVQVLCIVLQILYHNDTMCSMLLGLTMLGLDDFFHYK